MEEIRGQRIKVQPVDDYPIDAEELYNILDIIFSTPHEEESQSND